MASSLFLDRDRKQIVTTRCFFCEGKLFPQLASSVIVLTQALVEVKHLKIYNIKGFRSVRGEEGWKFIVCCLALHLNLAKGELG